MVVLELSRTLSHSVDRTEDDPPCRLDRENDLEKQ